MSARLAVLRSWVSRVVFPTVPPALLAVATRRRGRTRRRVVAVLAAWWVAVYAQYRRRGRAQTAREYTLLETANWDAYTQHYNERVPTIEEEFDIWGEYHQHRHEMRYDLVAAEVARHLGPGACVLDLGCGSALVADRLADVPARYFGMDFGGHHVDYAAKRFRDADHALEVTFTRGDGEHLPFRSETFDVVVMSEVIEHLMRPELAVWEVARVLRPGGLFVMTTNNASEMPLRSPLTNPLAWLEKAAGATHPSLISLRPWIWPHPVDPTVLAPGAPPVYMPHTHHIFGETAALFRTAGLDTVGFSTFEFPPPQSRTAAWLEAHGELGERVVAVIETMARRLPIVTRLGCHLFMVARKTAAPASSAPPPGTWPGPFSR